MEKSDYMKIYYQKNKERIKNYYTKRYYDNLEEQRKRCREYYSKNKEKCKARHGEYIRSTRKEMILAYGGKCTCCGENRYPFLTLEHVNKNGREERSLYGGCEAIRLRLKRLGWPKVGYTLLCMNCNWATRFKNSMCPHKQEVKNGVLSTDPI